MPQDSDPIFAKTSIRHDLTAILADTVAGIDFKIVFLIYIVYIMLSTDIFITRILGRFSGAIEYNQPTSWGVILQGTFFVLAYLIINGLNRQKII